jgi:hypothetical protein
MHKFKIINHSMHSERVRDRNREDLLAKHRRVIELCEMHFLRPRFLSFLALIINYHYIRSSIFANQIPQPPRRRNEISHFTPILIAIQPRPRKETANKRITSSTRNYSPGTNTSSIYMNSTPTDANKKSGFGSSIFFFFFLLLSLTSVPF